MNRTVIAVIVLVVAVVVAGYVFFFQDAGQVATGTAPTGSTTAEVDEATQAAIDFCTEKGGTVESVIAAEGTTYLCVTADGGKAEVSQYMADNKTE